MKRLLPAVALLTVSCSVGEITLAMPDDVIIAEVVLREGFGVQTAYLHRTTSDHGNARVFDAAITVREQGTDRIMYFEAVSDTVCLFGLGNRPLATRGTCYAARGTSDMVRAGARYHLDIRLPDGRQITGSTIVPGGFQIRNPRILTPGTEGVQACILPPMTPVELTWTRSHGAWAYLTEANMVGLIAALRAAGVELPSREGGDQVRLLGVSVGAADTTTAFPGDLGLFDRFDEDVHPVLVAIRDGLPADVRAYMAVAAADRNYVNWVRGGNFNPSGLVRVPSVTGDGTGVFGSLALRRFDLSTEAPETGGACIFGE